MFSLIVPVFKNEESISELLRALSELSSTMRGEMEVVFVIDGSPDRSLDLLVEALPTAPFQSQLVVLSRNFGSYCAVRAGIARARGSELAVMAADLQEPPELITSFRERLGRGDVDVVVGRREARCDPLGTKLSSALFWWCYRKIVQRDVPKGGVDVFACTREFADHLVSLPERNSSLVGLIFWLGFRRAEISYTRRERRHGRSAWTLRRRLRYLLDSTFAFSDLPMKLMSLVGVIGILLSTTLAVAILAARITGGTDVPGYTATVLAIMFFGGLNSLGIGMLGEYLWRTFENTKGRPPYVIARCLVFDGRP